MSRWRTLRFEFQAMASPCCLQIDGQDERAMRRAATQAIAEVRRIEHKFSRYRADSVIGRINSAAGQAPVDIDEETGALFDFAAQLWSLSDGLFDITSGVLRHAWDFKSGRPPQADTLQRLQALVGWQHVQRDGARLRLGQAGMELDFGGFGKEYATDRAAAVLLQHGFTHALLNLGGDLYALGARGLPECAGAAWQIELQHPRPDPTRPDRPLAQLPLLRGALATSGDYERFFMHDGQRYCHILDPRSGWPVTHWQCVSVLAPSTTSAGALCTIAMLKGDQAQAWLDGEHANYLAVRHDGDIVRSQG